MSMFSHFQAKKKKQLKKNKYQQMLYELVRLRREEVIRVDEMERQQKPKPSLRDTHSDEEKVWSEKVNTVRNRLTDKKRDSKERWNRFAGTGDEGGRGL